MSTLTSTQLDKSRVSKKSRAIIGDYKMANDLVWALTNGEMEDIGKLLVTCEDVNKVILDNGRTPLHVASDYGHAEVVDYLLSKGANVNVQDKHKITPLLNACYEGHADCVKLLLEKGADKSHKGPDGLCAIEAAETDAVKALLK